MSLVDYEIWTETKMQSNNNFVNQLKKDLLLMMLDDN